MALGKLKAESLDEAEKAKSVAHPLPPLMGLCLSHSSSDPAQVSADADIERTLKDLSDPKVKRYKILLLGAGESGKSTLLKQFRQIHGQPFDTEELADSKEVITRNVIKAMKTLCEHWAVWSAKPPLVS